MIKSTILLIISIAFVVYSGILLNRPANEIYVLTFTNSAAAFVTQILAAVCCWSGLTQVTINTDL